MLLEESQTASVGYTRRRDFEVWMSGDYEAGRSHIGITVCLPQSLSWNFHAIQCMQERWPFFKDSPGVKTNCRC